MRAKCTWRRPWSAERRKRVPGVQLMGHLIVFLWSCTSEELFIVKKLTQLLSLHFVCLCSMPVLCLLVLLSHLCHFNTYLFWIACPTVIALSWYFPIVLLLCSLSLSSFIFIFIYLLLVVCFLPLCLLYLWPTVPMLWACYGCDLLCLWFTLLLCLCFICFAYCPSAQCLLTDYEMNMKPSCDCCSGTSSVCYDCLLYVHSFNI